MFMIGTEEYNDESMRMNADSMICDNKKSQNSKVFLKNASSCVHTKMGKVVQKADKSIIKDNIIPNLIKGITIKVK